MARRTWKPKQIDIIKEAILAKPGRWKKKRLRHTPEQTWRQSERYEQSWTSSITVETGNIPLANVYSLFNMHYLMLVNVCVYAIDLQDIQLMKPSTLHIEEINSVADELQVVIEPVSQPLAVPTITTLSPPTTTTAATHEHVVSVDVPCTYT